MTWVLQDCDLVSYGKLKENIRKNRAEKFKLQVLVFWAL